MSERLQLQPRAFGDRLTDRAPSRPALEVRTHRKRSAGRPRRGRAGPQSRPSSTRRGVTRRHHGDRDVGIGRWSASRIVAAAVSTTCGRRPPARPAASRSVASRGRRSSSFLRPGDEPEGATASAQRARQHLDRVRAAARDVDAGMPPAHRPSTDNVTAPVSRAAPWKPTWIDVGAARNPTVNLPSSSLSRLSSVAPVMSEGGPLAPTPRRRTSDVISSSSGPCGSPASSASEHCRDADANVGAGVVPSAFGNRRHGEARSSLGRTVRAVRPALTTNQMPLEDDGRSHPACGSRRALRRSAPRPAPKLEPVATATIERARSPPREGWAWDPRASKCRQQA